MERLTPEQIENGKNTRNARIKKLLRDNRRTLQDLADALGVTQATISVRLKDGSTPIDSIEFMKAVAYLTGSTFNFVADGVDTNDRMRNLSGKDFVPKKPIKSMMPQAPVFEHAPVLVPERVLAKVYDHSGEALSVIVSPKDYDGYIKGYASQQFLSSLRNTSPLNVGDGESRIFEIAPGTLFPGRDSRLDVGDFVECRYVVDMTSISHKKQYVIVTDSGIFTGSLHYIVDSASGVFTVFAENTSLPTKSFPGLSVIEIWEVETRLGFFNFGLLQKAK